MSDTTVTTVLVNGPNPALVGDTIILQVIVQDATTPSNTPLGTVDILDGTSSPPVALVVGLPLVNGQATFATDDLIVGSHTIIANYHSTNSPPEASSTGNFIMVINPIPPRVLTSGVYPNRIAVSTLPIAGPWVSALTGPFDPTKDIEIYVDGIRITIVSFSYDGVNNRYLLYASTLFNLQGVVQVVFHMPLVPFIGVYSTYLTLQSSVPSPAAAGSSVTLTSMVASRATPIFNPGIPTGSVQFFDGNTSLGTVTVDLTGTAVFTISSLSVGVHQFSAVFTPSNTKIFSPSLSIIILESATTFSTMTALTVAPTNIIYGEG